MRALVIANGDPPSAALLDELREGAALVVAADGGARPALALGVMPDIVTGDLDSIGDAREAIPADRIRPNPDPNATDLEKAVALCLDEGCDAIDIIGAGGGRADHALANLSVLVSFSRRARVRMVDDRFAIELVDGEATIVPGLQVRRASGPYQGHQIVIIAHGGERVAFLGDLVPTPYHLQLACIAASDRQPEETLLVKRKILREAVQGGWLLVFSHGVTETAGYLQDRGGRLYLRPVSLD